MSAKIFAFLVAICGTFSGCHTAVNVAKPEVNAVKPKPTIYPGSAFVGFGSEDKDTIKVSLWGDVQCPGIYYFSRTATLLDLVKRIGTAGPTQDAWPGQIKLTWGAENDWKQNKTIRFRDMSEEELSRIPLQNEMVAFIPTRIL